MKKLGPPMLLVLGCALLSGCADSKQHVLSADASQVELRSIQTRAFDTADKKKTLRVVIATLQDLGFVIDKADYLLGSVSATKYLRDAWAAQGTAGLRITVSVRPRGESQLLVRANAQYGLTAIEEPKPYQDFFAALSRAMFLEAHHVQ